MKNNPYIGPRPFERSDRSNFFGRTRELRDLLSLIMAERVVLFYAQSGAGKTSLLNTQIVPKLEEEGFNVLPIARVGSDAPIGLKQDAISNIFVFSALLTLAGPQADADQLAQQTLAGFLAVSTDDDRPPLIIFDQFEEILTTHRDRWEEARGFFEQLRDALQAQPRLGVVLAMREDHLAGLDPYAALLPKRLKTRFRMELLRYDGALEAVKKPAQNAGCAYGTGVAERLVDDLRRIRSAGSVVRPADSTLGPTIEPVQLQVVCSRLWDNLPEREEKVITWPEIEQFGNIDRALTDFYESALQRAVQEANVTERQLRRWFGAELITPMKTRGLAWRGEQDTNGLPNAAVDVLERQHLIRAEVRAGAYWYELAHDRLVDPIVNSNAAWEQARMTSLRITAQKWQESKSADLMYSGSVLADAIRFTKTHPDDIEDYEHEFLAASLQAERARVRNRIVRLTVIVALALGMVITAALALLAWQSKQEADQQARKAQLAVARTWGAQGRNEFANNPLLGLGLALEGAKQAETADSNSAAYQSLLKEVHTMLRQGRVQALSDDDSLFTYLAPDKSMFVTVRNHAPGEIHFASDPAHTITLGAGIGSVNFFGDDYFWVYYPDSNSQEVRRVADGAEVNLAGYDESRDRLEAVSPGGRYYIASVIAPDRSDQFSASSDFQVRTVAEGHVLMTATSPLSFSPDVESKYVAANDGQLFETSSGRIIPLEGADNIQAIRFGKPADPYFAVYYGNDAALYRMSDAQVEYNSSNASQGGIALSPGATSGAGYYNLYTPWSSELYRLKDSTLVAPAGELVESDFSRDPASTYFALTYTDGHAELRRSADESVVPFPKPVKRVVFLSPPNAEYFVVNYADDTAELRRGAEAALVAELPGPISGAEDIIFSPDPESAGLVALSRDRQRAEIWTLQGAPRQLAKIDVDNVDNFGAVFDWPRQQVWIDYGRGRRDVLDLSALRAMEENPGTPSLDNLLEFACAHLLTPDRFNPAELEPYLGDDSIPTLCPTGP